MIYVLQRSDKKHLWLS